MAQAAARLHDQIEHTRARSMLIVGAVVGGVVAGAFAIATAPVSIPVLLGTAGLGVATGAGMGELAGHFSFMKVVTGGIAIPGSPNVFINGRPAARAHLDMADCSWHPAHPPVAQGSSNVFINGQPAARKGDRTACDAVILEGSPNVFIGGGTTTTDNISPEVSDRMHKTVQLIGLGSAAVLFGPAVALIGWYASEPIGKAVHNLTGKAYGEGTNSQIAAELALSGLMIGVAGRGAARGGRAGPVNDVLAAERPLGARGLFSGRDFDPALAGGPIRNLSVDNIRFTDRGVDVVARHTARFGEDAANDHMVGRLRSIAAGEIEPTIIDRNFYTHELREYTRYRRLGWESGQPAGDAGYDLWNHAHTATLEDYRIVGHPTPQLYHPEAIRLMGGY